MLLTWQTCKTCTTRAAIAWLLQLIEDGVQLLFPTPCEQQEGDSVEHQAEEHTESPGPDVDTDRVDHQYMHIVGSWDLCMCYLNGMDYYCTNGSLLTDHGDGR